MSQGFAVVRDGQPLVRTVSDLERGARVNGLLVCFGILVMASWGDEEITSAWAARAACSARKFAIRKVNVEVAQ